MVSVNPSLKVLIQDADAVVKGQTASSSFKMLQRQITKNPCTSAHKSGDKVIINSKILNILKKQRNSFCQIFHLIKIFLSNQLEK